MSGSDDYIALVMARDIADFERVHRTLASLAYLIGISGFPQLTATPCGNC
jgi:hypothetical protein